MNARQNVRFRPFLRRLYRSFCPQHVPRIASKRGARATLTARSTRKNPTRDSPGQLEPNDQNLVVFDASKIPKFPATGTPPVLDSPLIEILEFVSTVSVRREGFRDALAPRAESQEGEDSHSLQTVVSAQIRPATGKGHVPARIGLSGNPLAAQYLFTGKNNQIYENQTHRCFQTSATFCPFRWAGRV